MPTQLGPTKRRTARKEHRCSLCNGTIAPGDAYCIATNVYDGRVYDWKDCAACAEDKILNEVYDWAGYPDEGVTYETTWEWAHEARDAGPGHPEIVRRAEDYLRRAACKCERCEMTTPSGQAAGGDPA